MDCCGAKRVVMGRDLVCTSGQFGSCPVDFRNTEGFNHLRFVIFWHNFRHLAFPSDMPDIFVMPRLVKVGIWLGLDVKLAGWSMEMCSR